MAEALSTQAEVGLSDFFAYWAEEDLAYEHVSGAFKGQPRSKISSFVYHCPSVIVLVIVLFINPWTCVNLPSF